MTKCCLAERRPKGNRWIKDSLRDVSQS